MERLADGVRAELGRFGPQAGMAELLDRWPAAVGPAIAARAWPARIARDGTVHVHTADSMWAFELGHRAEEIATRLDVTHVRFSPGPLPEADAPPPAERPEPSAVDDERARAISSLIDDADLRETVQRTVALGLARAAADRGV